MFTVAESYDEVDGEGSILSYGVSAPSGEAILNITSIKEKMVHFVGKLNACRASEIHLADLVYDFLAD